MSTTPEDQFLSVVARARELSALLHQFEPSAREAAKSGLTARAASNSMRDLKALAGELPVLIRDMSPAVAGRIQITLGRSDSIAKFFAFSFVYEPKRDLAMLEQERFLGSGIYAIYYQGNGEPAYAPISGTETPIYIGKADPHEPYAETTEEQGPSLHLRLKEHAKSIRLGGLELSDFRYRCATVQSGMQAAVEEFLIRLFLPIWNKEVKVCFGIGKHGDAATTRTNRRSPWDTMHPGRKWADMTQDDQVLRGDIVAKIANHFAEHPAYTFEQLVTVLVGG